MINMHQNDDYNTFEEFKILPVLLSNVIVISEVSTLIERLYMVWIKKISDITKNIRKLW